MSLALGYLGAIVGAGFASGQEIIQFFTYYGLNGFKGGILALILFSLFGGMLMYMATRHSISSYQEMLHHLMGDKWAGFIDLMLTLFLFLGLSLMLSASGAVFHEHLYYPKQMGVLLACVMVGVCLYSGRNGLIKAYNLLVPLKILILMIISGYAALFLDNSHLDIYSGLINVKNESLWPIASLLYVAYNFSLAMVVLTEYQSIGNRKEVIWGAVWGGVILGMLLLCNCLALYRFLPLSLNYEVPMLFIAGVISPAAKLIYIIVLWVGILTTAIANAYGFAQRLAYLTKVKYSLSLFITLALAIPISLQSFSVLVSKVYPIFGILGIIILVVLITRTIKEIATKSLIKKA